MTRTLTLSAADLAAYRLRTGLGVVGEPDTAAEKTPNGPRPVQPACRKARPGERNEAAAADMLARLGLVIEDRQHAVAIGPHTYTADLLVRGPGGVRYLVEVKGPWRHGSAGRSRLAWDMARQATGMAGLWVERRPASRGKAAHWRIEVVG